MINVTNFERRSRFLVKAIADKVKFDNEFSHKYAYWALYLDDNRRRPREVDTCATSYCISILEAEKQRFVAGGGVGEYVYHDIIQQAVRTLLRLRGRNGAWPSVVEPKILQSPVLEYSGDVAIGDNYFALTALLDVGFLNEQFEYINNIPEELHELDGRIKYVWQTVEWLIKNQAGKDRCGWYYTNASIESSVPVTISTTNVITIFNRIKNSVKSIDRYTKLYEQIERTIDEVSEYLVIHLKADGGIGKDISSSASGSSLLHTCKTIDALIQSENCDYVDELASAINYVLNTCRNYCDFDFSSTSVDFYSETYNLVLPSEDEITIRHENYIEGVLLYSLLNILHLCSQSGSFISKVKIDEGAITSIVNKLIRQLENMQTKEGVYNGLFKCHVIRPEGMHPVYASFEGYRAFRMYIGLDKHILTETEKDKLKDEIISFNPFDSSLPYLFISYSHKNEDVVLQDVQQLKKQYNCWIDFENLDGGRSATDDDWTKKVQPVLESPNCKGVVMYISKEGMSDSLGLMREAEWVRDKKIDFYTFLVGFSNTITPQEMASIVGKIDDENSQQRIRKIQAFSYVGQAEKGPTEFSYYHRQDNFSHLSHRDFFNWLKKIELV